MKDWEEQLADETEVPPEIAASFVRISQRFLPLLEDGLPRDLDHPPMYLHPQNLRWNPKMKAWKMFFLFKWVFFRFHVNFSGECMA